LKARALMLLAMFLIAQSASAFITFTQLSDDVFVVSHRIKVLGSRGRAMKVVYEKSASLCVAAGFAYYEIIDQESQAAQENETANASIRIQLFHQEGSGRVDCQANANPEYTQQADAKLAKRGYVPPAEPEPTEATEATETCTIEQITAMVRAGLTDEQIKAACPDDR